METLFCIPKLHVFSHEFTRNLNYDVCRYMAKNRILRREGIPMYGVDFQLHSIAVSGTKIAFVYERISQPSYGNGSTFR